MAEKIENDTKVDEWTAVPDNVGTGPCSNPMCTRADCLDPRVTVARLEGDEYSGPFVIVTYLLDESHHFRINGEDFSMDDWDRPRLFALIRERYGTLGVTCIVEHIAGPGPVENSGLN